MKRHLQCAEQQVSPSNLTKYCACHEKWLDCFIVLTYETSFPMRGATGVTIQPRQILRLPRKMTLQDFKENLQKQVKRHFQCGADPTMIRAWSENENANRNPPRKWGYFARSPEAFSIVKYNVLHPILQSNFHQILRLPRKVTLQLHQVLRMPRKVPLERHQVLRLPRKMTRLLYRPHIWNVISNARSNRCHYPTSPNTAPATKNDTARCQRKSPKTGETSFPMRGRSDHDPTMIRAWSENENANRNPPRKWGYFARSPEAFSIVKYNVLHPILQSNFHQILRLPRKVTLQLHQVLRLPRKVPLERHQVLHLPRKMTRLLYRPHIWNVISNARSNRCHYPTSPNTAPATKNDTARCQRKSPKTGETSFPMQGRSDHDPTMIRAWSENENANRNPPRKWGYFARSPEAFSIVKYNVLHPILQSNFHQILRLPRKVTLQLHQVLRLPRKVPLERHQVLHLPRKVTLELHQVVHLPRKVTLELHQVLHLPRKVTLELHQVLRLPLYCNWTLLYSTLLDSTLLDTTLLDTTLRDTTLRDTTLLGSTLLASILHDSTLLDLLYLILLYLTLLYLTYSTWLYSTWLYSTWLYSTWHYSTWLYSTWLYSTWPTLLDSSLLDTTLLDLFYLTLLYLTLLYLTLFYLTLLYLTLLYLTLLYLTLLYLTLFYLTLLYLTLLYLTLLYLTLLYLTLFYLTLLYLTLLYLTLLYLTLLYLTLFYLTLLYLTLLYLTLLYLTLLYLTLLYLT